MATTKDLEQLVSAINKATGCTAGSVGEYYICYATGGAGLRRRTEGNGEEEPITGGRHTRGELFIMLRAFLAGIMAGKELR